MAAIGRFLRGVWRGLDGLRRVLHLILLLLIFGVLVGALKGTAPSLPSRAAILYIEPRGEIVEQRSGDPLAIAFNEAYGQGENETLLWDLTESIRAAAGDRRVAAILLSLDRLAGAGQPTLEEVAAAMRDFRASGKKIIATGTSLTQARYYLAAHADEVYLDPMGEVLIEGYERYRMYFKGLLDKLAVDVHLFRVGEYKSAAEDLVRSNMSEQDRAESLAYLTGLWESYKSAVAAARGLEPAVIEDYANGYIGALKRNAGDAARLAQEAGLVTGLKTAQQVREVLIDLAGEDKDGDPPAIGFTDYVRVHRAEQQLRPAKGRRVGVVVASGEILDGEQPSGAIGGRTAVQLLRGVRQNEDIAAVVLRIDSPGGSGLASEQIYREVAAIRAAGKPVVVSMGDLAASGGYYVAAPADRIIASPTTLTGSIGVFAAVPTLDRALGKVGITVDGVGTTALSGKLRLDRPLDPALRDYAQQSVEHFYEEFLARVSSGRGKTRDEIDGVARGRVWTGKDALEHGLIDALGGYGEAVKAAAELAQLPEGYDVRRIEPRLSLLEQLALQLQLRVARFSGRIASPAAGAFAAQFRPLAVVQKEFERVQRMALSGGPLAYCLCAVE